MVHLTMFHVLRPYHCFISQCEWMHLSNTVLTNLLYYEVTHCLCESYVPLNVSCEHCSKSTVTNCVQGVELLMHSKWGHWNWCPSNSVLSGWPWKCQVSCAAPWALRIRISEVEWNIAVDDSGSYQRRQCRLWCFSEGGRRADEGINPALSFGSKHSNAGENFVYSLCLIVDWIQF